MSHQFVDEILIDELKKVKKIIYVGINPVINDWRGNYWRDRPESINRQLEQDEKLRNNLNCIDFSKWSDDDIKHYTVDNIHYNVDGIKKVGEMISEHFQSKVVKSDK